ncbi:head GIN domain-containing protein [Massilia sp. 9096]|uniref:head GIN domain-containing protein n=1 Tax=Massilia sp. 9096 TaxID=1500894 RepID=UPI0005667BA7|nr:head GIN domain-containing protein [Massilia sp. 9096]
MRALLKTGFTLLLLAFLLIGISYSMLRAQVASGALAAGNRLAASESRPLDRSPGTVELSGPFNLVLRQGPAPALEVRGEQRVLANVDTTIDGDTLRIAPRGILLRHRQPIEVRVTLPALSTLRINGSGEHTVSGFSGERLALSMDGTGSMRFNGRYRIVHVGVHGSGDLELTGGNCEAMNAELTGSGSLTLVGAAQSLNAGVQGSGQLDARHLRAEVATLTHQGSGSSSIYARRQAEVTLTGSGDIAVYGNPDRRTVTRSGSGSVTFHD